MPDTNKVPLLLTAIGATAYSVLHDLLAPTNPKSKSLEELVAALRQHYEPKPLVIAEWFHFYRRSQSPTESIAEYITELRKLATTCSFGDHLDQALRDHIVCGVYSDTIQKRLLSEPDPTLAKVIQVAQSIEATHKSAQAIKSDPAVAKVASPAVNSRSDVPRSTMTTEGPRQPCYRCGVMGHNPASCNARNLVCHRCRKRGHLVQSMQKPD